MENQETTTTATTADTIDTTPPATTHVDAPAPAQDRTPARVRTFKDRAKRWGASDLIAISDVQGSSRVGVYTRPQPGGPLVLALILMSAEALWGFETVTEGGVEIAGAHILVTDGTATALIIPPHHTRDGKEETVALEVPK